MDDFLKNTVNPDISMAADRPSALDTKTPLVCLNFKVPLRVRQKFKTFAAYHNVSMTELLLKLLDDYLVAEANNSRSNARSKKK